MHKLRIRVVIIGLLVVLGCGFFSAIHFQPEAEAAVPGIQVEFSCGYHGTVRLGRKANFNVIVKGMSEKFKGTVVLQMLNAEGENIAYEKSVSLAPNEEKTVTFSLLVANELKECRIQVFGESGKSVYDTTRKVKMNQDMGKIMIGTLSGKKKSFEYLKTKECAVVSLPRKGEKLDACSLDAFDVILINEYDTSKLSKETIRGILEWVKAGGSVVFGTGKGYEKTLSGFTDQKVFQIKKPSVEKKQINVNLNDGKTALYHQQIPEKYKEAANYQERAISMSTFLTKIPQADSIVKEGGVWLMQRVPYGEGNFQVFSIDLGGKKLKNHLLSLEIQSQIFANLSGFKKYVLGESNYIGNEDMNLYQALKMPTSDSAPNIAPYLIIVFLYIGIVIPGIAFLLYRLQRQSLFWILIPCVAVIAMLGIGGYGRKTRTKDPMMRYISVLNYEKDQIKEHTLCSITPAYNRPYQFRMTSNHVQPINGSHFLYIDEFVQEKSQLQRDWNQRLIQQETTTSIAYQNCPSYSTHHYAVDDTYPSKGGYHAKFHYQLEGVSGVFQNQLGYDLNHCFLVGSDSVAYLGDVKNQSTSIVKAGEGTPLLSSDVTSLQDGLSKQIQSGGGKGLRESELVEKLGAISYELATYFERDSERSYIIGFADQKQSQSFLNDLSDEMQVDGLQMVVLPVSISPKEKDGEYYECDLGRNVQVIDGTSSYVQEYRMVSGNLTMEYTIPADRKVKALYFTEALNREYDSDLYIGFTGKIYLLNQKTMHYDPIFEKKDVVTKLSDYLTKDNHVTVKYKVDTQWADAIMTIPYISYGYERKAD